MGRKKKSSLGFLFWVALILLVIVVFLFSRDNINRVMDSTGFVDVVKDKFSSNSEESSEMKDSEETTQEDQDTLPVTEDEVPSEDKDSLKEKESEDKIKIVKEEPEEKPSPPPKTTDTREQKPITEKHSRKYKIYFIKVTDDGLIYPRDVQREITFTDSPLTETINSLLSGPSSAELNQDLINLIPKGTVLLSAAVREGVAYLNFNENFKFNTMGVEGHLAQLKQIVFTSTEFSTVEKVQFLVEGERIDFLSGEGVYIGKPLDRSSFS
jgi:germination protein M